MTHSIDTFRLEARRWLAANVPSEPCPEDGPDSREYILNWQKAQARGGWAGLSWPREVGGRGLSVLEQIIWFEEYARAGAPTPLNASFTMLNHAGPTLIACGTARSSACTPGAMIISTHFPKPSRAEPRKYSGTSLQNGFSVFLKDLAEQLCATASAREPGPPSSDSKRLESIGPQMRWCFRGSCPKPPHGIRADCPERTKSLSIHTIS
jgi:hypothetical protein